jgi:hypothetical protein
LITGAVVIGVLAAGGAGFAAVRLSSTSHNTMAPILTTTSYGNGLGGYGLGGGRLGGRGFDGGLGPGDDGGVGFGFRRFFGGGLAAAAAYLGLSSTQLQSDLANGETLAQIATSQGKTLGGLVDAMVAQVKKTLDTAVSQGILTQAQASQIAARLGARMEDMAHGIRPRRPYGGLREGAGSFGASPANA